MRHSLILCALAGCGSPEPAAVETVPQSDALSILYTGHGEGEIEPCG